MEKLKKKKKEKRIGEKKYDLKSFFMQSVCNPALALLPTIMITIVQEPFTAAKHHKKISNQKTSLYL